MAAVDIAAGAALMDELTAIIARAAQAVRDRSATSALRSKPDGSPVTAADDAAEAVICDGLKALLPGVPIIAEEAASRHKPDMAIGQGGGYFLVDPLDGTREFVAGRDEYTINIALMGAGSPVLGLIAAPALGLLWRGIVGSRAERMALGGGASSQPAPIRTRPRPSRDAVIMLSRSHLDARTRAYVDDLAPAKVLQCGSSLKFCRVAEAAADLYPRLAPTRDWDVAAGHAIVKAAGGEVTAPDGSPLRYGTPDLAIPAFIASGQPITA